MALELLHWIYILLVSLGLASAMPWPSQPYGPAERTPTVYERLWLRSLVGLALVALGALVLSFALPLSGPVCLAFGIAAIAFGVWRGAYRELPRFFAGWSGWLQVLFGLAALGCLTKAAAPSFYYDHLLYYIQTIRWAERYAVVPGLANVHDRLGFNQSWHLATALLNPAKPYDLDGVNEYLYAGTFGYYLVRIGTYTKVRLAVWQQVAAWAALVVLPLYLSNFLSSPSSDLVVVVYFWLLAELLLADTARLPGGSYGLPLLLAGYLITVKLSALPALGMVGAVAIARRQLVPMLRQSYVAILPILVWVARTWILTGYLIYPVPGLSSWALAPDWQLPASRVAACSQGIKNYARFFDEHHNERGYWWIRYPDMDTMPASRWLPIWLEAKTYLEVAAILVISASLVAGLVWVVRRRLAPPVVGIYLASGAGLLFWLMTAPGLRFALCYLLPLLMVASLASPKSPAGKGWLFSLSLLPAKLVRGSIALLGILTLWHTRDTRSLRSHLLSPSPYLQMPVRPSNNGVYYTPAIVIPGATYESCADAPLPCGERMIWPLARRGPTLQSGFRSLGDYTLGPNPR